MHGETPHDFAQLEKNQEVIMSALFGDPNDDSDLGLVKKVNTLYEVMTKGVTILDFFIGTGKAIITIGLLLGAWVTFTKYFHLTGESPINLEK